MDDKDTAIRVVLKIVRPTPDKPAGYLGAVSDYPPRDGEGWRRGRDLADGPCDEATLQKITDDVLAIMEGFPRAFDRDHSDGDTP